MATSFSANQYQNAFEAKKLQNWEVPTSYKERPDSQDGFTQIIANDEGHLVHGVSKSKKNPWGDFVGTWDLPKAIPGNRTKVPTARTTHAQQKLHCETDESQQVLSGKEKNRTRGGVKGKVGARVGSCRSVVISDPNPKKKVHKVYPKTGYPTPEQLENLTPVPNSPEVPQKAPSPGGAMMSPPPPMRPSPVEADPQEPIMGASPIVPGGRCSMTPTKSPQPPVPEIENS